MGERSGITLIVVLVVIVVAALVGVGALDAGRAVAGVARSSADHAEARALATAGVRAFAEELLVQRGAMLDGEEPSLTDEIELWRDGERRAVARLVPVGFEDRTIVSESAKLDLNRADAETLARLPQVDERTARSIVSARPSDGYASVTDLVRVAGLSPETVFGPRERWATDGLAERAPISEAEPALADLLTVFSAEPNLQRGLTPDYQQDAGTQRINLNRAWDEELRALLSDRYGDDIAGVVEQLSRRNEFENDERFVRALARLGVDPEDLAGVLDIYCTSPDPFLIGRIDLTRAIPEVVGCLPGITDEMATEITTRRDGMDDGLLASPAWLVTDELVTTPEFAVIAPWVCSRSLQWRFRIVTGYTDEASADDTLFETNVLEHQRVTEVVIDFAAPRPRIALLDDLTDRAMLASLIARTEVEPRSEGGLVPEFPEEDSIEASVRDPRRGIGSARRAREARERTRATPEEEFVQAGSPAEEGMDRRIGRWSARGTTSHGASR